MIRPTGACYPFVNYPVTVGPAYFNMHAAVKEFGKDVLFWISPNTSGDAWLTGRGLEYPSVDVPLNLGPVGEKRVDAEIRKWERIVQEFTQEGAIG